MSLLPFIIRLFKGKCQIRSLGYSFLDCFLHLQHSFVAWFTSSMVLFPQTQHTELEIIVLYPEPATSPDPLSTLFFTVLLLLDS